MAQEKIALVTGASTGIGRATAALLARHGYHVFGTSRTPQESPGPYFQMLVLDVRSDDSVRQCVEKVLERAGRIDLLINNAGYVHADPLEETSLEEARALFETNFFGLVRVTNAVLPVMRRQRSGRIINISSIAGLVGVPGEGFYSATKFAVEGYTEALRYEVEPLGIRVVLIEPGLFKTHLRLAVTSSDRPLDDYAALHESIRRLYKEGPPIGADPAVAARVIVRAAEHHRPRFRNLIGKDAFWLMAARQILPDCLFSIGVRRFLKSAKRPLRYD